MRKPGEGTIEVLPSGSARLRMTLATGERKDATFRTEAEAESARRGLLAKMAEAHMLPVGGPTVRGLGELFLDEREKSGRVRNIRTDRYRWALHVLSAPWADWPASRVEARDLRDWTEALERKRTSRLRGDNSGTLSRSTRRHCLVLVRRFYAWAIRRGYVTTNPAAEVEMPPPELRTAEAWTYLEPAEQERLLACVPVPERWAVAFAIGTGVRLREQWALELCDVHLDGEAPHVWIRYGGPRHAPTKSGKARRVPLFGLGLEGARRWFEALPSYAAHNPGGLMFPSVRGHHRGTKPPERRRAHVTKKGVRIPADGWAEWLERAQIGRPFRWHDLRHTCGSSLISGWWGRRWSLEEIQHLLGHASRSTTEIYAHLGESALTVAARETPGSPRAVHETARARQDSNLRPTAPEIAGKRNGLEGVRGPGGQSVDEMAEEAIRAIRDGRADQVEIARRLARAVLEDPRVRLAQRVIDGGPLAAAIGLADLVLAASGRAPAGDRRWAARRRA